MQYNTSNFLIKSAAIRVFWNGWESTTTQLQRCGWQLAAEQDIASHSLRIIMKHAVNKIYGISDNLSIDYFHIQDAGRYLEIPIRHMASSMQIQLMERSFAFKPIDAETQFVDMPKFKSIQDFAIFAPALVRTNEIIVPSDTVDTLMQRILEMQDPMVKKYYREEALKNKDAAPQQKFVAQIISFDGMKKVA